MLSPSFILRWLLIVAAGAFGLHYTWQFAKSRHGGGYRVVPLMQGSKSVGLPLAGVAVDPNRKDIYAVVGGRKSQLPGDFFVLWKRQDGEHYALTVFNGNNGARTFCQLDRGGKLETLHNLSSANNSPPIETERNAEEEAALRLVVQALPPSFELALKP